MAPVEHLNPEGLPRNPVFSQGVAVSGPHRTIYVGGQDAVDATGNIVGDDIGAQTRQILGNLQRVLAEAGAGLEHVVKWTVYALDGQPAGPAVQAFQEVWGARANPPAISVVFVAALGRPGFLAEIEAVAVVPE